MDRGGTCLLWRRGGDVSGCVRHSLDPAILVDMLEELGRGSDQTASSVAKRPERFEIMQKGYSPRIVLMLVCMECWKG